MSYVCEVYEELYNSSGSFQALQGIKEQLNVNIVGEESLEEVLKVTGDIVKKAACKTKPGKGDDTEGYTSDAILNAPDILFDQLAMVYMSWLLHGTVTSSLLACAF